MANEVVPSLQNTRQQPGGGPRGGGDNLQMITIAQDVVAALGNIRNAINSTFPNWVTVPASHSASGVQGTVAYDSTSLYLCYSANAWLKFNGTTSF